MSESGLRARASLLMFMLRTLLAFSSKERVPVDAHDPSLAERVAG